MKNVMISGKERKSFYSVNLLQQNYQWNTLLFYNEKALHSIKEKRTQIPSKWSWEYLYLGTSM